MGETIFDTYRGLADSLRSSGIPVLPIGIAGDEYPAVPVFHMLDDSLVSEELLTGMASSVTTGEGGLAKHLLPYLGHDQSTCVVLAGYSQGAWVIGNYLANSPATLSRLTAVVLFGDPRFDGSSDVAVGADASSQGILRSSHMPSGIRISGAYYKDMSGKVRSFCAPGDPVCDYSGATLQNKLDCVRPEPWCRHFGYISNGYVGAADNFLADSVEATSPTTSTLAISSTGTYREGELVYARLNFTDPNEQALGFGFEGIGDNSWGRESHPFSEPSYGLVSPGRVDYPFNLNCGHPNQYESDIRMWIYGDDDITQPVTIHLACRNTSHPG